MQASSIDPLEKHGLTIVKFLQANVHGPGASPKTKGGKKGGKGKDRSSKPEKFDGNCFWCGWYGHVMKDCRKKAAGKPRVTQSPRVSDPKAKAEEAMARKERRPLMIGRMVKMIHHLDAGMGERIDLTIDSGCAACALPVGVASAV